MKKITLLLIYLTILTIPFQKSLVIGSISVNKILGILLAITVICLVLIKNEVKKTPIAFTALFLYGLLTLISFFWATDGESTIGKFVLLVQLLFMFWAIREFVDTENEMNKVLMANVYGCVILCCIMIYNYMTNSFVYYESRFIPDGYNANDIGYTLVLSLPIVWYLFYKKSKWFILLLPLFMYCITLTASRTAFITACFVVVAILIYSMKRLNFKTILLIIISIFGVVVGYKFIPEETIIRLQTIKYELFSGTLNGRTNIWDAGLEVLSHSALFGVGYGSYEESTVQYNGLGVETSAHNTFISILVEQGVVGLLLFLIFLLATIYNSITIKGHPLEKWLCITLLGSWFIISMSKHSEVQKFTWVAFAIVWMVVSLYKKFPSTKKKKSISVHNFNYSTPVRTALRNTEQ